MGNEPETQDMLKAADRLITAMADLAHKSTVDTGIAAVLAWFIFDWIGELVHWYGWVVLAIGVWMTVRTLLGFVSLTLFAPVKWFFRRLRKAAAK